MNRFVKRPFLLLPLSAFCFLGLFVFFKKQNVEATAQPDKISGAYEALLNLSAVQTYPSGHIPKNAHFSAWEQANNMRTLSENGINNPAPWEAMGPFNRGGRTLALAFNPQNPNTIYAGSASGGLWRSYTAGVGAHAWHQVPIDFPILAVSCIAFPEGDSSVMYIGTGEVYNIEGSGTGAAYRATRGSVGMGILKTTDGGSTWTKSLDWTAAQERGIWQIKVAPTNPNLVYAATTHGIWKSTDAGGAWSQVLSTSMGTDLLIHPTNPDLILAACGNLGSAGWGIYRSTDAGQNWEHISDNLPLGFQGKIQINYAPSNPNVVYGSFGNGFESSSGATSLCRSDDFGATWAVQNTEDYSKWQGWFSHDVAVNPLDEDIIVTIGIEAWVSYDAGYTLTQASIGGIGPANAPSGGQSDDPNFIHSDIHDVLWHPTEANTFYTASDGGINRTQDGGLTFEMLTGAYQTAQFYNGISVSPYDSTFFMGGFQDNGTNLWNGDNTWNLMFGGDGAWTAVDPFDTDNRYYSYQFLNVIKSVGSSTYSLNIPGFTPVSFIAPYLLSQYDGQTMYAGSSGIAKSTDAGESWTMTNGGGRLDGINPAISMEMAAENPEVLYVGTAPRYPFNNGRGHIFVTKNGGQSFLDITGDLPDRFPMDITTDPTDESTAYVTFSGYGTGHVYRTRDYGVTWEDISLGLPDVPTNAVIIDPLYPNHIYVGNDLGIFASVDDGLTWMPYMDGLPTAVMVFDLKISPSDRKLRVGTHGNGAYQRALLPPNFVFAKNKTQLEIGLRVFPNPIQEKNTQIEFSFQDTNPLNLVLVDMQGRIIEVVKIGAFTKGRHQIAWPFKAAVQAGSYQLLVRTGRGTAVQQVVVL